MTLIPKIVEIIEWTKRLELDIELGVYGARDIENKKNKDFQKFLNKLLFEMLQSPQPIYPTTLNNFLFMLRQPVISWGLFSKEELENENIKESFTILDDEMGITPEALELLNEEQSFMESSSKIVREAMIMCREHYDIFGNESMQRQYIEFRSYLINNPITNADDIESFCFMNRFEPFLSTAIENCYEDIPLHYKYKCQSCGWTLEEKTKGYYICVKKECRKKLDISTLKNYKIDANQNKRVRKSILMTTVIPGKKELALKDDLEKMGAMVELFPDIERKGDIHASLVNNGRIEYGFIDVKDYSRPKRLAEELLKEIEKGSLKTKMIAIPNEKATKKYVELINNTLKEHGHGAVQVFSFKQIKQIFKINGNPKLKKYLKHHILEGTEEKNVQILF
jgi:hypothetical protein